MAENAHVTMIKERLTMAGINFSNNELKEYLDKPDSLGKTAKDVILPEGYKRCGSCGKAMKLHLFNKNRASKTGCTGNCKECQRIAARKSYKKTKQKRNYKEYYQKHKDDKRERARAYYHDNKEKIRESQLKYQRSAKGKKVMQKAHKKRNEALSTNRGIPYTRGIVIDRDSRGKSKPICYICGKPIESILGKDLHIDHVIPVVQGGLDCFTNVACVHSKCNLTKEKDARNIEVSQVEEIEELANNYINQFPEIFDELMELK